MFGHAAFIARAWAWEQEAETWLRAGLRYKSEPSDGICLLQCTTFPVGKDTRLGKRRGCQAVNALQNKHHLGIGINPSAFFCRRYKYETCVMFFRLMMMEGRWEIPSSPTAGGRRGVNECGRGRVHFWAYYHKSSSFIFSQLSYQGSA